MTNIKGKEKRKFIEGRLLSVKADLENAENQMQTFLQKNKDLNSPLLLLKKDRIERNIKLYTQLYLSLSDQLELAKIEEIQEASVLQILDEPYVPLGPSNKAIKMRKKFIFISGIQTFL